MTLFQKSWKGLVTCFLIMGNKRMAVKIQNVDVWKIGLPQRIYQSVHRVHRVTWAILYYIYWALFAKDLNIKFWSLILVHHSWDMDRKMCWWCMGNMRICTGKVIKLKAYCVCKPFIYGVTHVVFGQIAQYIVAYSNCFICEDTMYLTQFCKPFKVNV